ncbi:hypothetical protein [Streptomyces sp. NRRL S-337]|nr:hypothetical protein [Streptomyces sp. NRRL S-337]
MARGPQKADLSKQSGAHGYVDSASGTPVAKAFRSVSASQCLAGLPVG